MNFFSFEREYRDIAKKGLVVRPAESQANRDILALVKDGWVVRRIDIRGSRSFRNDFVMIVKFEHEERIVKHIKGMK